MRDFLESRGMNKKCCRADGLSDGAKYNEIRVAGKAHAKELQFYSKKFFDYLSENKKNRSKEIKLAWRCYTVNIFQKYQLDLFGLYALH